jgi:gliding motility-associated-like protein
MRMRKFTKLALALAFCPLVGIANTADFTPLAVCQGSQSTFSSTSVASGGESIVLWEWDLDSDGQFDNASGPVVSYQFDNSGTFQVGLRITTDLGTQVAAYKLVTVNPVPMAAFSVADVCKGNNSMVLSSSTVASGDIASWEWDLDNDGQYDDATGESVSHNFGNAGSYVVGLRVTSDLGCQSTATGGAVVDPSPTANLTAQNVCLGDETTLNGIATVSSGLIASYEWELNGNNLFDDATGVQFTNQFISDGNYQIGLQVTTDQGCVADTFKLVTIAPYPYINFSFNTACQGEDVQFNNFTGNVVGTIGYTWTFGPFGVSTAVAPAFEFANSGTFPITLVGLTSYGCSASLTQEITVSPAPTAEFTFSEVCVGAQSSFGNTSTPNGSTIQSYLWNFDDSNVSASVNPFHNFLFPGSYDVSLIAYTTAGCRDTVTHVVSVWENPTPQITASGPVAFCEGGNVLLTVNPPGVVTLWSTGDLTQGITASEAGTYTAAIVDGKGCRGETEIVIIVYELPTLVASNDTIVSLGEDVPLWVSGANSYSWAPETFLDFPLSATPISSPTNDLIYTVTGEDLNGCTDTEDVSVRVTIDYNLKPVNLFTPNGDGSNERFYVGNIDQYSDCGVTVFNRYGNQVFSEKPYLNNWTGTFNNSPLPEGSYYYIIDCDGRPERFDGSVTILRNK